MSIEDNGGAAFPKAGLDPWHRAVEVNPGMTLRDYFAAKAMQSLIACVFNDASLEWKDKIEGSAEDAYRLADTMLEARKK